MASGSISLSSGKAWRGKIEWSAKANTAGNYSEVYVHATMWKTDDWLTSSNSYTSGTISIDGEKYDLIGYQEFKDTVTIFEDTITIDHDSDGTKSISISLSCKGQAQTSLSGATLSGSGTAVLDTIHRSASLIVSSGTLGTAQTITIDSDSSSLTYTIQYECDDHTGTICTKTSSKSVSWTPSLDLAKANTTGTSVSVKLTLTTYSGSTIIGTSSKTASYSIPASVKPSFTATFTDAMGYKDVYGSYMQMLSRLKIVVSASSMYGATIKAYKITVNNETFTESEATTGVLTQSGSVAIRIVVTDSRNRTLQNDYTITVAEYALPNVSALSVHRCDKDGTENDQGEYVLVTFSATADSMDGKNTVTYKLRYKKTTVSSYTTANLTALTDDFSVSGETYTFAADTGASYDVELILTDNFGSVSRATTASTAATIMHFKASGHGIGLGKVAERDNGMDVGWDIYMNGNSIHDLPEPKAAEDAATKKYVDTALANFAPDTEPDTEALTLDKVYPVGSIYLSTASTSPATLFGGSWTQIKDRFLLAAGSTYSAGSTGGEATHKLTVDEMPSHSHGNVRTYSSDGDGSVSTGESSGSNDSSQYTEMEGGGKAHNNMPPYLVVYVWKRTA